MKRFRPWLMALLFVSALSAQTRMEDVRSFTLDNGMKFLVVEDHSIPNANYYCTTRWAPAMRSPASRGSPISSST